MTCPPCPFITSCIKSRVDFQVYCDVEPKRQALAQANSELAAATEKLEALRKKLEVSAGDNPWRSSQEVVPLPAWPPPLP